MVKYVIHRGNLHDVRQQIGDDLTDISDTIAPLLTWNWPKGDGAPGSVLTTDGNRGLYWTPPTNPPIVVEDDDQTDVVIVEAPAWTIAPVSVQATQISAPAHVTFSCTLEATTNNRTVWMGVLVDSVQVGTLYSTVLQRDEETFVRHVWDINTPNGNEVIQVEMQSDGAGCNLRGTITSTIITLIQPT